MAGSGSLAATLAASNPRYRNIRIALTVLALAAGITVFAENAVLQWLSLAFRDTSKLRGVTSQLALHIPLDEAARRAGEPRFAGPLALLIGFVLLRLLRIGVDAWGRTLLSRLQIRSRAEVEGEILSHLQRQGDDFFGSRPIAEILNRLSGDIDRALDARDAYIRLFRLAVMIAGNLYFFVLQDWRLALAGVATCTLGVLWMDRVAWPVGRTEKSLLETDDKVRSHFEDLLRAAPEVQVGNLFASSREYMARVQQDRETVFSRVAWLDARLNAVQGIAALGSMASLFLVTLYFLVAQSPEVGVALVPIILKALPELFANASSVVMQRLSLVRSHTSIQRLLEFDSPLETHSITSRDAAAAASVRYDGVTYQYPSPIGIPQGGVQSVSTEMQTGKWIAVIGPTGAGKSTFLQLLLGRLQPQTGAVLHGETDLRAFSPEQRAAIHSFMPQRFSILDTTLRRNITFGRVEPQPQRLPTEDLWVLNESGLGDLCRRKALDMAPRPDDLSGLLASRILGLRGAAWKRLSEISVPFSKYGEGPTDPKHWVLEHLLEGRCDRAGCVERLLSPQARRPLRRIIGTPLGEALLAHGQGVLLAYRSLLRLPNYQHFARLSPFYLDERTWQLWTATQSMAEASFTSKPEAAMLISVALTSPAGGTASTDRHRMPEWESGIQILRGLCDSVWAPFEQDSLHPFMTWRENLLFSTVEARNDRIETRVEQQLLDLLAAEGLTDELTEIGLDFPVGRAGARLSGGQGQLVALCRTLLRQTPVVVLDEPTSALDPTSRARVAQLLHQWKQGRVIVTTSHDPEFVRQADEVRLFEHGRLVRSGTFEDLVHSSETMRNLLRVETPVSGPRIRRVK